MLIWEGKQYFGIFREALILANSTFESFLYYNDKVNMDQGLLWLCGHVDYGRILIYISHYIRFEEDVGN